MSSNHGLNRGTAVKPVVDYSRLQDTAFRHDRLCNLTAIVVGAGALGNEVVKVLGLLGISKVSVADPDSVEPSNLTRSVFFRMPGLSSSNKAEAITGTAQMIFPDTTFEALPMEIADVGLLKLKQADLLFSCVHSDLARLETAYLCSKIGLPWCDAGLGGRSYSHGRVTWFPGASGACFGCMLPARRRRELLTNWDLTATRCFDPESPDISPSTPTMASIIGSFQVDFGLKNLLGDCQEAKTVELHLDIIPQIGMFHISQSAQCPFHWHGGDEVQFQPMPPSQTTVGKWLSELTVGTCTKATLLLDWPICTKARCCRCRFIWEPMLRVASFRRAVCPHCHANAPISFECIRSIDQQSRWASRVFADLPLPQNHLLTVGLQGEDR